MQTTDEVTLAGEVFERIASAACERVVAQVNEDRDRAEQVATEFESALHHAVDEHAKLADIAVAEQVGLDRAKNLLRREVLRGIERGAKSRREGQVAWEDAIRRGGRLGLGNVEIANAAGVTHAAVRKLLERPEQTSDTGEFSEPAETDAADREDDAVGP